MPTQAAIDCRRDFEITKASRFMADQPSDGSVAAASFEVSHSAGVIIMNGYSTLEDLVGALRENASNDVEFAQRVALVCISLIETKAEPIAAVRVTFRIQ